MTVCPKHRAALGAWWRPIIKCYHPRTKAGMKNKPADV